MKMRTKLLTLAAVPASIMAIAAVPAQAQVAGVATANSTFALARAKALGPAFQQIETTYKSYVDQMQGKQREIQGLLAQLDKNGDKNVDQAEMDAATAAKNPALDQIETKEREMEGLRAPLIKAQMYVIDQLIAKYGQAQQTVVTAKKLNYILAPEAFVWAPPSVDVTPAITAELDKLVPTANTTPPANWNPTQQTAAVYQQVQQLLSAAAQQQAARAQQQQAAPAAGQQPTGR